VELDDEDDPVNEGGLALFHAAALFSGEAGALKK
jgi:hypothetical protein